MKTPIGFQTLMAAALLVACVAVTFGEEPLRAPLRDDVIVQPVPLAPESYCEPAPYWFVRSHAAAQHRLERGSGLSMHRTCRDGRLINSSAMNLQANLVPGTPICIFVHGSFSSSRHQVQDAPGTYRWIRSMAPQQPVHVIFFSWPSGAPYTQFFPLDLTVRGQRAEFNGFHLAQLIAMCPQESPVCLIGHSHGARTVLSATHLLGGGIVDDMVSPAAASSRHRLRAVVVAAAVDHDWLNPNERYGRTLYRAEVLSLRNRVDFPLHLYPLTAPLTRPALALVGFTDGDRYEMGPLGYRAIELDVSELVGSSHRWHKYSESPAIAASIAPFVYFTEPGAISPSGAPQAEAGDAPPVAGPSWP